MSVVLMTTKTQQWLRLGNRECTILDAMLEWAKATAKTSPERIQIMEDGEKYIRSGGEHPRIFSVHRFDGGVPGIGWGSMAVEVMGQPVEARPLRDRAGRRAAKTNGVEGIVSSREGGREAAIERVAGAGGLDHRPRVHGRDQFGLLRGVK